MQLPAPFAPVGDHIGVALPGGRGLFTTASLDLAGDDAAANRARLAELVGAPLAWVRQVHGARVALRADAAGAPEADGQATDRAGIAVAVLVADCLPVAVIGERAVAMLHAGWRGLAGGVLEEGVRALRELGDAGPLQAAIGPGAGGCCYEVGPEVQAAFGRPPAQGTIDLKAIAGERLAAAGVAEVHDARLCTLCGGEGVFFSHRRKGATGRQAGVAWRS